MWLPRFINLMCGIKGMKILHIHAKSTIKVDLSKIKDKLPEKLLLFTTAQYIDQIKDMQKQIGAKIIKPKRSHTINKGQILGCSRISGDELLGQDAILFVGDGEFHPQAAADTLLDVFCYNPKTEKLTKLDRSYIKKIQNKKRLALNTFYRSKDIGIIVTTKHGQSRMKFIDKIKSQFSDKNFYILISETLNISGLNDFSFCQCFINTACPRIGIDDSCDKPILNVEDLDELNVNW